jgi:D-tyrosyl-tRNA(Tyr) deacylase
MRGLIQRVSQARVEVEDEIVASIGPGLLVFIGVAREDTEADAAWLAAKVADLRIFEDEAGKLNRSVADVGGSVLAVSQFTLYGDARKGRRPSFSRAAAPEDAERLYLRCIDDLRGRGLGVRTGRFRAHMKVSLLNDGPVTIWLDSREA